MPGYGRHRQIGFFGKPASLYVVLTRRQALVASLGASVAARRAAFAKASQPAVPVSFAVPAHACDCHTHMFGDPQKFPFWAGRTYTPETALPQEMAALHRALHIERVVIVTPSVYGTDNSATLYGIKARGPNARGVAVIDEKTPERGLEAMDRGGVRGIRLNLSVAGQNDPQAARRRFQAAGKLLRRPGWHIQIFTNLAVISAIKPLVLDSPVPVVFDHFGGLQAALGLDQPGFSDVIDLLRSGKAYVKISGAYRSSTQAPDYSDMRPFAQALIAANPDRVLWGTDWPHPDTAAGRPPSELTHLLPIDDGRLLNQFVLWAPDPAVRTKILADNPARLYGFQH
jgi:predicted TIM-barrel fold metal-dependent hydrolase